MITTKRIVVFILITVMILTIFNLTACNNKDKQEKVSITDIDRKYEEITKRLIDREITITTMESCTSGFIASLITDTSGASEIFKGAFITYSNEAKVKQGVNNDIIEKYGVYSKETAIDMARSCKEKYNADIGIGVTGSIGRIDPNNTDSVVGEVYVGILYKGDVLSKKLDINGYSNRLEAKLMIADKLYDVLSELLDKDISDK